MRIERTRGAVSGFLLILLGAWGGVILFVGPYFNYGFGPDKTWMWELNRLWLNVLPGAAAVLAGLILLGFAEQISMAAAAWLAIVAGAWFAVGAPLSMFWHHRVMATGAPMGGAHRQALEFVGIYYGLGAAIVFFGALALGRLSVVGYRDVIAREEVEHGRHGGRWRRRHGAEAVADGATTRPVEGEPRREPVADQPVAPAAAPPTQPATGAAPAAQPTQPVSTAAPAATSGAEPPPERGAVRTAPSPRQHRPPRWPRSWWAGRRVQ